MRKLYTFIVLSLFFTARIYAQTGELQGKVTDEKTGEGIPFAPIVLLQNGEQKAVGYTDDDGHYVIKPLVPGEYTLIVQYTGYVPQQYNELKIFADQFSRQDVIMKQGENMLPEVYVVTDPLIEPGKTSTGSNFTREEIDQAAPRDIGTLASLTAGVSQRDDGAALNIAGSRSDGTQYVVDGIKIRGALALPKSAIEQIQVVTGGVEAKYGDALGGFISVTTRGPSKEYNGAFELVTSEFLDGYGYNLASFNLSGPILVKNRKTDSAMSKIGFFVSGEYERNKDASPSAVPFYKVKDDVLANLEQNPLTFSPTSSGLVPTASFLTENDLETTKARMNVENYSGRFSGKLDFRLSSYINLTVGGDYQLDHFKNWSYNGSLIAYETANQDQTNNTYRGFVRFTQTFPTALNKDKESTFQNAYYSLQADYTKNTEIAQNNDFETSYFDYGYIGKFSTDRTPIYFFGQDSLTGLNAWLLAGYVDTLVTFEAGDKNPTLSRYTSQYYELVGSDPFGYYQSIFDIQNGGGLINGDLPTSTATVYSMFLNAGYPSAAYLKRNNDQFHFALNASVDIVKAGKGDKGRHAVSFGFEYEQRTDRRYTVAPFGLWGLARQLANRHIQTLDTKNPMPVYDAFGVFLDTINYNRLNLTENQSYFDESLRSEFGYGELDFIDVDALDPSTLSLDMFSPDELLNNGGAYYSAYGYDYLGNRLTQQPSIDDYFTATDENGNFSRNQAAYRPNYAAAYVQDKFNFRDLVFNIGLRVDRFDNNQFVLKDKYSLYPIRTAAEVTDLGAHPSNIGSDYYVYVNDIEEPSSVVGYRDGDTWYNAQGTEVTDPKVIAQASSTGQISPYLVNNDLDNQELSSSSFKDYVPQFTFMPRIAFSFPISDQALFFAHYDVLTQRPSGTDSRNVALATMYQYYFFRQLQGTVFSNPDLEPEKTIDYQVGFKQALGKTSAITIAGTYRELKDLIQVANVSYAYPQEYITYTNSDFGTVKSIELTYELRRLKNQNVRLEANYTLQFAAGTGSSATSGINLVGSGQPNLRTIVPFSYDQRHNITVAADYRFSEGKNYNGPVIGKNQTQFLANTGLNLIFRAGSGTPYSRQTDATPTQLFGVATQTSLDGSVNGSRLPWSFKVDAKIDKDFLLGGGTKTDEATGVTQQKRAYYLNVYFLVRNVFNTANVLSVYAYTGDPDDDGYIESAAGQTAASNQLSPETFSMLYGIKENYPYNYSLARRIQLGAVINF